MFFRANLRKLPAEESLGRRRDVPRSQQRSHAICHVAPEAADVILPQAAGMADQLLHNGQRLPLIAVMVSRRSVQCGVHIDGAGGCRADGQGKRERLRKKKQPQVSPYVGHVAFLYLVLLPCADATILKNSKADVNLLGFFAVFL